MSLYEKDSIVALATPQGIGALAIVRVSGSSLASLFQDLALIKKIKPRYVYYRPLMSVNGEVLDNAVITFYKGPSSFTGEDVLEISCHGGEVVSKNIINDLVARGCRYAAPGEFSRRAFLNGKINLSEAESINNIITSSSKAGAQTGLMELNGSASNHLVQIKDSLINLLTIIEHELDFVENEITETSDVIFKKRIDECLALINKVTEGSLIGNKLRTGFKVALVGPPNAGKSSLFNALLGYEHAIISEKKGTTRDALEVFVEIKGLPVLLIDTAGHWSGKDDLDALGVKKTNKIIQEADILVIVDERDPKKFIKSFSINKKPIIFVSSKSDIKKPSDLNSNFINISSIENKNLDVLLTELSTVIRGSFFKEDVFLCTSRQVVLIKKVRDSLLSLNKGLRETDLVERAFIVRSGADLMREIFGEIYSEEVLNNIFKGFCVGK